MSNATAAKPSRCPTDLEVKVEGVGLRVAVGMTLQCHIIPLDDGSLQQDLEANLLRLI